MRQKILATGFERFGDSRPVNISSEVILPELQSQRSESVETAILPVLFSLTFNTIRQLIDEHRPQAIVMFGITDNGDPIKLERTAQNSYGDKRPDNSGVIKHGAIDPTGPERVISTLPLGKIGEQLEKQDIPYKYNDYAGNYVCNETFYRALILSKQLGIPCGLVHVGSDFNHEQIRTAATTIIDAVLES